MLDGSSVKLKNHRHVLVCANVNVHIAVGDNAHDLVAPATAKLIEANLHPHRCLLENALVGAHSRTSTGAIGAVLRSPRVKREEAAARARALEILGIFGNRLLPRLQHLAFSLSYANRRRMEIARALVSEPVLLLLDEPTAGMSPEETHLTGEMVQRLNANGMTVLAIEHDMAFVRQVAQRVTVLHLGQVFAQGSIDQIVADERVAAIYLGQAHA